MSEKKGKNENIPVYVEPADYFPEELRKKYKLGEYAEEKTNTDCGGIQPQDIPDEI